MGSSRSVPVPKRADGPPPKTVVNLLKTSFPSDPAPPVVVAPEPEVELPPIDDEFGRKLTHYEETRRAAVDADIRHYRQTMLQAVDQEMSTLRQQGYQAGVDAGKQKGESDYTDMIKTVFDLLNHIQQAAVAHFNQHEGAIVELAVAIAEKLLHGSIADNPERIQPIINDAIRRITDKNRVIIKVNPEDAPATRHYREHILATLTDIRSLEVTEDPTQSRGGCIIETQLGFIDASLKTKIATLHAVIQRLER